MDKSQRSQGFLLDCINPENSQMHEYDCFRDYNLARFWYSPGKRKHM